jgi:hypothetical protein
MSKNLNIAIFCIVITCGIGARGQPTNAGLPGDDFKPLPRISGQQGSGPVYLIGPKGTTVYSDMHPNYIVSGGKVVPYTNSAATLPSHTSGTNKVNRKYQPRPYQPMIPQKAQKELETAYKALQDLQQKEPGRTLRLEKLVTEANEQPEVQKKLKEIQKYVHDYVGKKSPADMEALEIMTKPKEIMQHNGLPGNIVY